MILPVVAGILLNGRGDYLLAQRPPGKAMAGFWEFPGGKVEAGETLRQALDRELSEELGIRVDCASLWMTRQFDYPHARVAVSFFRVLAWAGEPRPCEFQTLGWFDPAGILPEGLALLPANIPLISALSLPPVYGVTRAWELGEERMLTVIGEACARGLRLLQVREKSWSLERISDFVQRIRQRTQPWPLRILVNGDPELAQRTGADGVHLPARFLGILKDRPTLPWVGASCHSRGELEQAQGLGVDFAVLGPVCPTQTHPAAQPLGWSGFTALRQESALPVYAIGGLNGLALSRAIRQGAQGIAVMRGLEDWGEEKIPQHLCGQGAT
ncbi:Nudix family hydrolase [Ferrovum sp.]|uniref:Nudix family hydrolase n=1 Tax=Ferrovum sp. TaxID=2609467 RepID=UPI00261F575C|nr:Nudix family hydrolase [Ferrovum sp.]